MTAPILTLEIRSDRDVVLARQRARQIAGLLGFDAQDQTRIATAVSEMARNAFRYAGSGKIQFSLETERSSFVVLITDPGGLSAEAVATTEQGAGAGIVAARRLMDEFDIQFTADHGTRVVLGKYLPRRSTHPTPERLSWIADELARQRPSDPLEEIQQQNQELLRTLVELRSQKSALAHANRELEETNRGVVALYAELDERADYLQRANEIKTRFLSNMTHEFRTPLNSILSLSRILLQRFDGELTAEQEKQVRFIERSAEALSELVNDLLDLGKVEAGKIVVRPSQFSVTDLFATLRGMLRPMTAQNTAVELVFDDPVDLPIMVTDESKVSQILRNFISNAIKYTERGEVRVRATPGPDGTVVFSVADTGIGIADEHQDRIFQEYTQIESALQHRIKGTGLGLPLSRKLAELLGGRVHVHSEPGKGSTFTAVLPSHFQGSVDAALDADLACQLDPSRTPVLFVDDNAETLLIHEKLLKGTRYQMLSARTLNEARACLQRIKPAVIVLDILLQNESSWGFIAELRRSDELGDVPIVVITVIENEKQALALGANAFHSKPVPREWLIATLDELSEGRPRPTLLVTDDDEVSRYLLRGLLMKERYDVVEATSGYECLYYARSVRPRAIFLDLLMPGLDGFAVLDQLESDPELGRIPVIVHTAKPLSEGDRARLRHASAILHKQTESHEAALASVQDALIAAGLGGGGNGGAEERTEDGHA
jgi:signal transduction histidine kinase/CheY-like chemotaxis protein